MKWSHFHDATYRTSISDLAFAFFYVHEMMVPSVVSKSSVGGQPWNELNGVIMQHPVLKLISLLDPRLH